MVDGWGTVWAPERPSPALGETSGDTGQVPSGGYLCRDYGPRLVHHPSPSEPFD
jgi:hypothetical protein